MTREIARLDHATGISVTIKARYPDGGSEVQGVGFRLPLCGPIDGLGRLADQLARELQRSLFSDAYQPRDVKALIRFLEGQDAPHE